MFLRRKKSRKSQAADLLGNYLKIEAATKAAKGASKAAKGTAAYKTAQQKTPALGRVPLIAAVIAAVVGTAALVVAKARGGKDEESSDEE